MVTLVYQRVYVPGSLKCVKFLPFGLFFCEKAHILHIWKIQVYFNRKVEIHPL